MVRSDPVVQHGLKHSQRGVGKDRQVEIGRMILRQLKSHTSPLKSTYDILAADRSTSCP